MCGIVHSIVFDSNVVDATLRHIVWCFVAHWLQILTTLQKEMPVLHLMYVHIGSGKATIFRSAWSSRSREEKVGRNGDQAKRMKKVPCLTLPLALQCHNLCWSKRRLYMTPIPRPFATRPQCEFSQISRKAVRYAMNVFFHCTVVGGVAGAARTGGLHTLANATMQQ